MPSARHGLCAAVCALAACRSPSVTARVHTGPTAPASSSAGHGHLPINGLQMYYEVHGPADGTPLVLVPGGGSTIGASYGLLLPLLARDHRIIAVEEQAHGRTSDRGRPSSFEDSADDIAALLDRLGVARADVMGFSNGASIALQLAIRHPTRVRRLVFASSMTRRTGTAPGFWDMFTNPRFEDMPRQLKDEFLRVNPDPAKLRLMFDRDVERMRAFRDVPAADIAAVTVPTLILCGDRDIPTTAHSVELSHLFPHARLVILPSGHGDYLGEPVGDTAASRYAEVTAWLLGQFLGAPE